MRGRRRACRPEAGNQAAQADPGGGSADCPARSPQGRCSGQGADAPLPLCSGIGPITPAGAVRTARLPGNLAPDRQEGRVPRGIVIRSLSLPLARHPQMMQHIKSILQGLTWEREIMPSWSRAIAGRGSAALSLRQASGLPLAGPRPAVPPSLLTAFRTGSRVPAVEPGPRSRLSESQTRRS
jgi:hypothetical protein